MHQRYQKPKQHDPDCAAPAKATHNPPQRCQVNVYPINRQLSPYVIKARTCLRLSSRSKNRPAVRTRRQSEGGGHRIRLFRG